MTIDQRRLAGSQPRLLHPPYEATITRAPARPLVQVPPNLRDLAAPLYGWLPIGDRENDLTAQHAGEPLGQRIVVSGRVLDEDGRPVSGSLIEIWQCNAAGRYRHASDDHPARLDPSFTGAGRTLTDDDGRYWFTTIRPGAYPWKNHHNAWRPSHIHFSLFGASLPSRLATQMYFPGDPLMPMDPILQSIPDERARQRLVSVFDLELTQPHLALGYRFDIVLRGRSSTPFEPRT